MILGWLQDVAVWFFVAMTIGAMILCVVTLYWYVWGKLMERIKRKKRE